MSLRNWVPLDNKKNAPTELFASRISAVKDRSLLDTERKLNVRKTFETRPGRFLNVLCTFNLRPVSITPTNLISFSEEETFVCTGR